MGGGDVASMTRPPSKLLAAWPHLSSHPRGYLYHLLLATTIIPRGNDWPGLPMWTAAVGCSCLAQPSDRPADTKAWPLPSWHLAWVAAPLGTNFAGTPFRSWCFTACSRHRPGVPAAFSHLSRSQDHRHLAPPFTFYFSFVFLPAPLFRYGIGQSGLTATDPRSGFLKD